LADVTDKLIDLHQVLTECRLSKKQLAAYTMPHTRKQFPPHFLHIHSSMIRSLGVWLMIKHGQTADAHKALLACPNICNGNCACKSQTGQTHLVPSSEAAPNKVRPEVLNFADEIEHGLILHPITE